jgi:methylated-DNA-[protein]-cysteine S-methyltransferase
MTALYTAKIKSPIGTLLLTASEKGLTKLDFSSGSSTDRVPQNGKSGGSEEEHCWSRSTGTAAEAADPQDKPTQARAKAEAVAQEAALQLEAYFAGSRKDFDLPLAPEGSPFQQRTWRELREIPYGETISYAELARRTGNPKAVRAVGAANSRNPLPIFFPCHRVVGSDGSLTGYGGGLPIKRQLLELEHRHRSELQRQEGRSG